MTRSLLAAALLGVAAVGCSTPKGDSATAPARPVTAREGDVVLHVPDMH